MSDPKRHPSLPLVSRPTFDDRTQTDEPAGSPRLPSITQPTFDDKTELDPRTELATLPGAATQDKPQDRDPPATGSPRPATRLPPASLDPEAYAGRGLDDLGPPASGLFPKPEMEIDANGRLVTPGRKPMTTPAHGLPDADLLTVGVEAWPTAPDPITKPNPSAPMVVPRPPDRPEPARPVLSPRPEPTPPKEVPKRDSGGLPPLRRELPPSRMQVPPALGVSRSSAPTDETSAVPEVPARNVDVDADADADAGAEVEEEAGEEDLTPMPARPRRGVWLAVKVALALILLGGAALYVVVARPQALTSLVARPAPTIEIRSRPNGATVQINGELVGTTPLVRENLYPTDRDTEIQVSHRGYKTWTWKFRGGKSFSLDVELRR
jgi:hypothetical protein